MLVFFLTFSISGNLFSQNEKFKAAFIYNFTKYVEWSAIDKDGYFIIGVYGSTEVARHLNVVANKMKVGNQPIKVKVFKTVADVEKCHLLYVPNNKSKELNSIVQLPHLKSTLIVGDRSETISFGAGISFYTNDGEVKFEVSKNNIDKAGLKVNPALLILGKANTM